MANTAGVRWRKSSYSGSGNNCVEVASWRKSSYSGSGNNCVEVGTGTDVVGIRDSKNPTGPALVTSTTAWARFITSLRR